MLAVLLTVTIQCLNIGAEKWVSVDGEYILFITLRTSQSTPGNMVHVMSNMTWSVVVVIRQLLAALRKPKPVGSVVGLKLWPVFIMLIAAAQHFNQNGNV